VEAVVFDETAVEAGLAFGASSAGAKASLGGCLLGVTEGVRGYVANSDRG